MKVKQKRTTPSVPYAKPSKQTQRKNKQKQQDWIEELDATTLDVLSELNQPKKVVNKKSVQEKQQEYEKYHKDVTHAVDLLSKQHIE